MESSSATRIRRHSIKLGSASSATMNNLSALLMMLVASNPLEGTHRATRTGSNGADNGPLYHVVAIIAVCWATMLSIGSDSICLRSPGCQGNGYISASNS